MALQDIGDEQIPEHIRVSLDKATGGFLVDEEHNWSTRRFIAFRPGAEGSAWDVKVFHLPDRRSFPPIGPHSRCLGLFNGMVYFECADQTFAIPVEKLPEVEDLGYSIG